MHVCGDVCWHMVIVCMANTSGPLMGDEVKVGSV